MRSRLFFLTALIVFVMMGSTFVRNSEATTESAANAFQPDYDPSPTVTSTHSDHIVREMGFLDQNFDADHILRATIMIVIESIQPTTVILTNGMGSLVQYHEEEFLVTHNHWEAIGDMDVVRLYDSENRLIQQIFGYEFKGLIVYQDAGTLILRAPGELSVSVKPGIIPSAFHLQQGDIVQVAQRGQPDREKVEILAGVIEEIDTSSDVPVYTIRSLNGKAMVHGDSGGGVWYEETLVANNWSVITLRIHTDSPDDDPSIRSIATDLSIAAMLPKDVLLSHTSLAGK